MRRFLSARDFLASPVGGYLVAGNFAFMYPHRALTGLALWGHPNESDINALLPIMDVPLRPESGPRKSLVDMEFMRGLDPLAFRVLAQYVANRSGYLADAITQQAIIRPSGFTGALVAGFYAVVPHSYPVQVFDALSPALAWLAIEHERDFCDVVRDTRGTAQHRDPLVSRMQVAISDPAAPAHLPEIARTLGVSRRTLQRRLAKADTTFQAELSASKLARARHLMLTSGLSLTTIAMELGFSSLQHFSGCFRKQQGECPSAWRSRRVSEGERPHHLR